MSDDELRRQAQAEKIGEALAVAAGQAMHDIAQGGPATVIAFGAAAATLLGSALATLKGNGQAEAIPGYLTTYFKYVARLLAQEGIEVSFGFKMDEKPIHPENRPEAGEGSAL